MWSLNDESGGIGWGAPEAMAEIMSLHEQLAIEYSSILISYANPDGNYIEHIELQKEVLRGLARLGKVRPLLIKDAMPYLRNNILSENEEIKRLSKSILEIIFQTDNGLNYLPLKSSICRSYGLILAYLFHFNNNIFQT